MSAASGYLLSGIKIIDSIIKPNKTQTVETEPQESSQVIANNNNNNNNNNNQDDKNLNTDINLPPLKKTRNLLQTCTNEN
jgi:hypothetical protein